MRDRLAFQCLPWYDAYMTLRWLLILRALEGGAMYGRELGASLNIPSGSVYTTLDRMIAQGLVKMRATEKTHEQGGNHRRYYSLTAKGSKALKEATETLTVTARGRKYD